ncbi:MAG: alpha/beta fold hydrolase [Pseudomonadota bacterium]
MPPAERAPDWPAGVSLVRRRFVDGPYGQLHLRETKLAASGSLPLICLHMSPKSGADFAALLEQTGRRRKCVAPDYPGHGESDPPSAEPPVRIEDYAAACWRAVAAVGLDEVALFGTHTGTEVAAEMAMQRPGAVRRIVMLGAPVLSDAEVEAFAEAFEPVPLDREGTRFRDVWQQVVRRAGADMTLPMMAASFLESLRGGEGYEWGHRAAFAYVPRFREVLPELPMPVDLVNAADDLHEATERALPLLKNGRLVDRPDWGHGVLRARPGEVAALLDSLLDG